ncbi:MAG: hypothetical protein J6K20_00130 [Thermoguttaceae bacterium]|nr:hypothetical protein [Thermoguttaceae bacterium]
MLKRLEELEELYARHYYNFKEDFKVALYTFIQIGKAIAEQNYDAMLELKDRKEKNEREGVERYVWIVSRADEVHLNRRDWLDAVKLATEHVVDGKDETLEKALETRNKARESYFIENKTFMDAALSVVIEAVNYYRDERNESRRAKKFPNAEDFKQC